MYSRLLHVTFCPTYLKANHKSNISSKPMLLYFMVHTYAGIFKITSYDAFDLCTLRKERIKDGATPENHVGRHSDFFFNIHGSVHRDSILIRSNELQQYAGVYLLQNYCTCFGCISHPSSGVHQTVTAASGTGHSVRATTFRQRGLLGHAGGRLLL